MPWRINRIVSLAAALGLLAAHPSGAESSREEMSTEAVDRLWIPSFSIRGGATVQFMDSSVTSRCARGRPERAILQQGPGGSGGIFGDRLACSDPGEDLAGSPTVDEELALFQTMGIDGVPDELCPGTNSPDGRDACLRPASDGRDAAVSPFVAFAVELMTPRIDLIPGRPRAFVGGEYLAIFAQERKIAREANASSLGWPVAPPLSTDGPAVQVIGPELSGYGSELASEVQRNAWAARGGLAFPFQFRERRLWLKPTFNWLQYTVDFEGLVVAGIKADPVDRASADNRGGDGIREVVFSSSGSETFNGIGPGLELELEVGRFGPLGVSIFADTAAHFVMGERTFTSSQELPCPAFDDSNPMRGTGCASPLIENLVLSTTNPVLEPVFDAMIGADTYRARFEFGVERVIYRGGVGIRFHWLGR